MSRKFFVLSVITAVFFTVVLVSCEKEAEKLLETAKNENGEHKVEYDDQNRITKLLWYDKKDDVFKKTTLSYGDRSITMKIEDVGYDEFLTTGEYTKLDDKVIIKTDKKIEVEY
jgi:CRISPR/Cas system CSM-associated protein Csm3 (group 7 of RAMP superfamily)